MSNAVPKHLLVLADGTEIGSGQVGDNAVRSVSYTQTVADDTDLAPGAACACKLEIELWVQPGHALRITSGTEMTCYRLDAVGGREKIGVFRAVKPTKASRNTYKVYAYDAVSRLDGIQSTWLRSIQGQFPMTLWAFAQALAARCGVTIANTALPANGSYQVQAFYADDLTGRQLLAWVAQAAGCFLRANADGALEFAWYKDRRDIVIGPGEGAAASTLLADSTGALLQEADGYYLLAAAAADADGVTPYYDGTLSYEDYTCAVVDKVQIRQSSDDVGVVFPADEAGTNALTIEGNLLLTTSTDAALRPVAQALYAQMQSAAYTPCTVRIPAAQAAALGLGAGQIVRVQDARGRVFDTWIMTASWSANGVTLESTGNASRDGSAATNQQIYKNLTGKMLEIRTSVDGLELKASELQGNYTELLLTVEGILATVSAQDGRLATLELTVDGIETTVSAQDGRLATLELTVDGIETTVSGKIDGNQAQTLINQSLDSITLSAANGSESSTLTLKYGSTTLASAQITFNGLVNFVTQSDLSTAGRTTINGGNIKTGVIDSTSGYTHLDLAAGIFRVGVSTTDRVEITPEGIVWYAGDNVYGQLSHGRIRTEDTHMWITSDSRYQMLGWLHEDTGDYQCLEVEQVDNAVSVPNRLNVGGVCSVRSLTAWDGKDRVVQTDHWGNRAIAAMESPEPMFFDAGSGEIDETGVCYIEINPVYGATTSATVVRRWYVTPTSDGALWVDKQPWGAIVHGAPGMAFDWMVGSIQRGYEGIYAEINTDNYPNVHYKPGDGLNDAVLRGVFDPMADAVTDYLDETDYNAILREALTA